MEVRWIADGEEARANDLHNHFYEKERQLRQWRWEFVENNYDKKPIPYSVVVDDGRIVGTQAFIPIRMIDRDGVFWTAKSEETLVDPKYRGKRLFEKMYDLCFKYADEHSFVSIWGFTAATKAFKRQGFEVPGKTSQLFMPFSVRSIATTTDDSDSAGTLKKVGLKLGCLLAQTVSTVKLSLANPPQKPKLELRSWDHPDNTCSDLCRKFIDQFGGTTIYRDAAYLQWRLFDNPYVKSTVKGLYKGDDLVGWVAYTIGDDGMGYLVDLMAVGDEQEIHDYVTRLLITAALGTRAMGATGIRGWHVTNHPFDKIILDRAKKVGFYYIERGNPAVFYFCDAAKNRQSHRDFDSHFITRIYTEGVLG